MLCDLAASVPKKLGAEGICESRQQRRIEGLNNARSRHDIVCTFRAVCVLRSVGGRVRILCATHRITVKHGAFKVAESRGIRDVRSITLAGVHIAPWVKA